MNKLRLFVVSTAVAAFLIAPAAFAQTPTNISIVSGNGQITCPLCTQQGFGLQSFEPTIVKVTDANGSPVVGAIVNWTVAMGVGTFPNGTQSMATTTDANGISSLQYLVGFGSLNGSPLNPFIANTVNATISNNASVSFYLTQALVGTTTSSTNAPVFIAVQNLTPASVPACTTCINPGDLVTGPAGSTSTVQFKVQVYVPGGGSPSVVPNVSFRLIPNVPDPPSPAPPTISCATGPGADPGSVLTDQSGSAVCTAVLGSTTGFGTFFGLVGGVTSSFVDSKPRGFFQTGNYSLNVTPGVAGMLSIVSGNNQGGNPGQVLTSPLVATVADSGGNPLSGQAVVWTVSPAGAATLTGTSTTSGSNGRIQTNVSLASSASGVIQVKVALASNPNVSSTFTITANAQISGLQIVSGNSQSAIVNNAFGLPLVVQLSTGSGSSLANIPVSFTLTGPGSLSSSTATTDSTGKAQVTVTAGATPGTVTITASASGFTQSFNLTVIQQGPTITANNFVNGADFQRGSISPCSIATIIAPGLAPSLQGAVAYNGIGALPYTLAGDSLTFNGAQAPIFNVANLNGQQQLTFQVPCGLAPGSSVPVVITAGGSTVNVNVPVLPSSPGLFMSQLVGGGTVPVLERPDGSFVSASNPARRGENLIAYVTGLGPTSPPVTTNSLPIPGSKAVIQGTVIVGINGNGANLVDATLTPDIIGVFAVTFTVPSTVSSGTNANFSIGVLPQGSNIVNYSNLGMFPVQ